VIDKALIAVKGQQLAVLVVGREQRQPLDALGKGARVSAQPRRRCCRSGFGRCRQGFLSSFFLLSSLELSDTKVYEPYIRQGVRRGRQGFKRCRWLKPCRWTAARTRAAPASWCTVSGVLNLRTTTTQKCAAVLRRARIWGSSTFVSLDSRLESSKEEEEDQVLGVADKVLGVIDKALIFVY